MDKEPVVKLTFEDTKGIELAGDANVAIYNTCLSAKEVKALAGK